MPLLKSQIELLKGTQNLGILVEFCNLIYLKSLLKEYSLTLINLKRYPWGK